MKRSLSLGFGIALLGSVAAFAQEAAPVEATPEGGMAPDAAEFTVAFADDAWNGETIPDGQQCASDGGEGATPAFDVSGIPEGTTDILVAFSDESNEPMNNGGHGSISFPVTAGETTMTLPSVPGETDELPEGVTIAAPNARGDEATPGYIPPCSGGAGNLYSALVTAIDHTGAELASARIELGTY
jgi:hypothetical protein